MLCLGLQHSQEQHPARAHTLDMTLYLRQQHMHSATHMDSKMNNAAPAKPKAKALSRRICAHCGVLVSDDAGGGGGGDSLAGAGLGAPLPYVLTFATANGPADFVCLHVQIVVILIA